MSKIKSIVCDNMQYCIICGSPYVEIHHIFFGNPDRKLSDKYGLIVPLCHLHHNEPPYGAHFNREFNYELKRKGQQAFEKIYGHDKFIEIFKKIYL